MNTPTRTITVLIALSMLTPGLALARNAPAAEAREADAARLKAERAARAAHDQAEAAQKQADAAHAQKVASRVAPARARSMRVVPEEYSMFSRSFRPSRSGGVGSVFVIPSAEIETKDLLTINEDINVMSRIFATNLQQAHISPSGGSLLVGDRNFLFDALSGRSRTSIQSLYLQGYGVLFLMKVDFPLLPSRQVEQQAATEKEDEGDKVWQDTRRQLYEPEQVAKRRAGDSAVKYDAEKVENLKTTLIGALKHAANIRNLKPDESVIVTITGGSESAGNITSTITATGQVMIHDKERRTMEIVNVPQPSDFRLSAPVVLVIRAKKSDIDSFAKGDIDLKQFRQRVQMISYPVLAGETGRRSALGMMYEESSGGLY